MHAHKGRDQGACAQLHSRKISWPKSGSGSQKNIYFDFVKTISVSMYLTSVYPKASKGLTSKPQSGEVGWSNKTECVQSL